VVPVQPSQRGSAIAHTVFTASLSLCRRFAATLRDRRLCTLILSFAPMWFCITLLFTAVPALAPRAVRASRRQRAESRALRGPALVEQGIPGKRGHKGQSLACDQRLYRCTRHAASPLDLSQGTMPEAQLALLGFGLRLDGARLPFAVFLSHTRSCHPLRRRDHERRRTDRLPLDCGRGRAFGLLWLAAAGGESFGLALQALSVRPAVVALTCGVLLLLAVPFLFAAGRHSELGATHA
jgi:hypothetical protein